jgi:hypothetical protein
LYICTAFRLCGPMPVKCLLQMGVRRAGLQDLDPLLSKIFGES